MKADADEIKVTEAKSLFLEWVKRCKEAAEVAKRKELEADLAQRKLITLRQNIRDLPASTVTETALTMMRTQTVKIILKWIRRMSFCMYSFLSLRTPRQR